ARAEISKSISVHIEAVDESRVDTKKNADEYTSYIKQVSAQILKGSAVVETWISSKNELYVLVCIDKTSQEQGIKDIEKEMLDKLNQKVKVSVDVSEKK
ncbi:MAG TPA: LPP20 family lipoprotein, partial [bacterium]|nr:LPP20 family lipoprotein [bacterium]